MELIIREKPGELYSVFSTLLLACNLEYFTNQITEQWGMELDDNLPQGINKIKNHKLLNSEDIRLFFDINLNIDDFFIDTKLLWNSENLDEYFKKLKSQDIKSMREKLLENLIIDKSSKDYYLDQLFSKEDRLSLEPILDLLNKQDIDNNIKWNFLLLFQNPKYYIEKFINLINGFLPIYNELKEQYKERYKDFLIWIESKINKFGVDFINKYLKILNLQEFDKVHLSYSLFGMITTNIDTSTNECYVYLGILFQDYVEQMISKLDIEKHLMVFKVFSDKTRFEIIKILIEEENFGQEIAEKLNISTATVSYHMDYLLGASLVEIKKRGRKVFYKINKDEIRNSISFLEKELKL